MGVNTTFEGELQLMNWGESSANGAWVKFWLNAEDLEAFRNLKTRSGKIAGHRVMAVLVEIGDDEKPVERKGGPLSREAAIKCGEVLFREFVADRMELDRQATKEDCADYIRQYCEVDSRADLDYDERAAKDFNRIMQTFSAWVRDREIVA